MKPEILLLCLSDPACTGRAIRGVSENIARQWHFSASDQKTFSSKDLAIVSSSYYLSSIVNKDGSID